MNNNGRLRARRRRRPAAASRVTLAAAGVTALAVTLLASGCTTARAPAAGTGPATITAKATMAPATAPAPAITVPSPRPASIPAATSTPAATAPPPATRVETFQPMGQQPGPWRGQNQGAQPLSRWPLHDEVVIRRGKPVRVEMFHRQRAFSRPCFAPAAQSGVTQVACSDSPWSGAVIVSLARPLARSSRGTPGRPRPSTPGRWFSPMARNAG